MWSTPTELYPMYVAPVLAPSGQVNVIEPQTEGRAEVRYSVQRITGIVAYKQHGPMSTLHWVAKC